MKFSIIVPVYNAQNRLRRCVDSIINQEYSNYELILVNDGSTDNSADVCKSYAYKYDNIVYYEKENGGASSARNTGLEIAKGDYILFVDSDDYVDGNYFSVLDSHCLENGLSVFTYTWLKKNSAEIRKISPELLKNDISNFEKFRLLMLSRTINSPCAKIFDRYLIEKLKLRFEESMIVAEDFNFCLRYAAFCKEFYIENTSVYYYDITNETSLVHKRKTGMIDVYPIVFDYAFETIQLTDFNESEKNSLFRIWDKLHTDSFITCVMEEQKDKEQSFFTTMSVIKDMCKKFYGRYHADYGYENIIHRFVRFCIKRRLALVLYSSCKCYTIIRR